MTQTPTFITRFPGAPACAQCGDRFATNQPRFRSVWGEVCERCNDAGSTLLKPTDYARPAFDPIGKPHVSLGPKNGPDGNVYVVIGAVVGALRAAGRRDQSRVFHQRAHGCKTYDDVLALANDYVDLEFGEPS